MEMILTKFKLTITFMALFVQFGVETLRRGTPTGFTKASWPVVITNGQDMADGPSLQWLWVGGLKKTDLMAKEFFTRATISNTKDLGIKQYSSCRQNNLT